MNEPHQLQFIQQRTIKVQHDSIVHFALHTFRNDVIVTYPYKESIVLSCINEPDIAGQFPYSIQSIELPKGRILTELIKDVDLRSIYGKLKVLERQEIGIDPIIVADASLEPPKPNVLQAHLAPASSTASSANKLIAITTYGECLILHKNNAKAKSWDNVVCNLTKYLINASNTSKKSSMSTTTHITQYADLRALLDAYICTACAWHDNGEIIYIATAAGCLYVFKLNESPTCLEMYFQLPTNIGRVSYLKAFDDFVVAASSNGLISIYRLLPNNEFTSAVLVEQGLLWTDTDELGCTQLIVQHNQTPNGGYSIVCAKAAFVIVFLISCEGSLLGCTNIRIADIKVTGIAQFADNDFIVTTIRGKVFRVRFNYAMKGEMALELSLKSEQIPSPHNSEGAVGAMYGVGTTLNKALWFFLMNDVRNQGSRETARYSVLMLCKPSTFNPLDVIDNLEFDTVDPYLDIVWSFRMDAWSAEAGGPYTTYLPLNGDIELPPVMDHSLLRKLQIRLEIANVRSRHSSFVLKTYNETFIDEVEFLQLAIQIVHIILRLQYLRQHLTVSPNGALTPFQSRSAFFLHKAFRHLLEKLTNCSPDAERNSALNGIKLKFAELACQQLAAKCLPPPKCVFEDICFVCNNAMDNQTFTCPHCENIYRCSVSFVPLPIFCRQQCTQCSILAYNDESNSNNLTEIFSQFEAVKCTFCCASFVK